MKTKLPCLFILLALLTGTNHAAAQGQNLFVIDAGTGRIIEITPAGVQSTFATNLISPSGLAFNGAGDLFVADYQGVQNNGNIYEYTPDGTRSTFASGLQEPVAVAIDSAGDLFVANGAGGDIIEFTNGVATAQGIFASGLVFPDGLAFDNAGNLFVTVEGNNGNTAGYIYEITNGIASEQGTFVASGLVYPANPALNSTDDLFVTDPGHIYEYQTPATAQSTFALLYSGGLAFDSAGDLFESDSSGKIYEFTNGVATAQGTFASGFIQPTSLAFSPNPTLTNVVVSPANPIIGVNSNQQFTATGYYSDGSSQILTNGGNSGNGAWTAMVGMPTAKAAAASTAVNGQFYVVSGDSFDNTVYDYNPAANAWTNKAVLPSNFAFAGTAGIGTKLYFFGGGAGSDMDNGVSSELYIYDALSNGWSTGAFMNFQRGEMGVGVINGKIYAAGSAGAAYTSFGNLQIYDPASNTWTNGHAMPTACSAGGAAVINGKLYVVGGYSYTGIGITGTPLGTLSVYDPTTDSWTTNSPMPTPRGNLGAAAVNGLLYAIDGSTASGAATNLVEVYNPVTDSWSTGAPTLIAHTYLQPVAINGTIYIAGNGPGNASITNAESYSPQNLLWSSSSTTVASINTSGVATGLTNGSTTITAASGSVSGNATLTVVLPPTISTQPTNTSVPSNGAVTLSVGANGGGLSYQWQFNGTNIAGATGASLTITNVSGNAGVYTVIVSNAAGSVSSSSVLVASVDIKFFAGVIVNGPIGSNYLIQATSNLLNGWTTVTNVALPTQPYIYIDYGSLTNRQQFYRAIPQ